MNRFVFRTWAVYRVAVEVYKLVHAIASTLPRDQVHWAWQMRRAATSIVLNLAEGAGEYSLLEKARFYRMSQRSAWEVAGNLFLAVDCGVLDLNEIAPVIKLLDEIAAMLTAMQKKCEANERNRLSRKRRSARDTSEPHQRSPSPSPSPYKGRQ